MKIAIIALPFIIGAIMFFVNLSKQNARNRKRRLSYIDYKGKEQKL